MARPIPTPELIRPTRLRVTSPSGPLLLCTVAMLGAGMLALTQPEGPANVRLPALPGVPLTAYPSHRLTIDEGQKLLLDGVAVERSVLMARLQGVVVAHPRSILRIRAHAALPYEVVRSITHDAYAAGFAVVELEVEPERTP